MKNIEVSDEIYAELERAAQETGDSLAGVVAGGVGLLGIFTTAMGQEFSLVVIDPSGRVVFDVTAEYRQAESEFHAKNKTGGNPLESAPNLVDSAPVV